MIKTLALCFFILLIDVAITPSINIIAYQSSSKNIVKVDFIGINYNKSYLKNISLSEIYEIKNMLDAQGKTLSYKPLETIKLIFTKLERFDLMEKNDTEFLVDLYQKNVNLEKILKSNKFMYSSKDFANNFCYLILHGINNSDNAITSYFGILLMFIAFSCLYTNLIFLAYGMFFLAFLLLAPSVIYNKISPLKLRVLIDSPGPNELYSFGLKGFVNLDNKYLMIWGFRGIRISIPDTYESYYIGHASAINILIDRGGSG